MSVVTVPVTMQVPKESKEVVDAFVALYEGVKKGGAAGAMEALDDLVVAAEGWEKLADEVRSHHADELAGYLVQQLGAALRPAPEPA